MNPAETLQIIYPNDTHSHIVSPFLDECYELNASIESHRKDPQPYAGVEEYLPTVITLFFAKPFIDSFLKKAGEDGYVLFKKAASALIARANQLKVKMLSSGDLKVDPDYPFSRSISIYSFTQDRTKIKFLMPMVLTESESFEVIDALIDALLNNSIIINDDETLRKHTVLLAYSFDEKSWVVYDPKPNKNG